MVSKSGVVVAGNGTLEAAIELGWREVAVHRVPWRDLSKARAFAIAENRTSDLGAWDEAQLGQQIGELSASGWDASTLGFDSPDLTRLGQAPDPLRPEPGDDDVPAAPKRATTRVGDLWELGDHRLLCGDATELRALRRLMGSGRAHVVFTDPPYGVSYSSASGKHDAIAGDDLRRDDLLRFLTAAFRAAVKVTRPTAGWYVWHASATRDDFSAALSRVGLLERQYLIWAKPGIVLGHADYQWAHEPCFYAALDGETPDWYGDRTQATVWRVAARTNDAAVAATALARGVVITDGEGHALHVTPTLPKRLARTLRLGDGETVTLSGNDEASTVWEVGRDAPNPLHPTQKPVELVRRALINSSQAREIVLDPFAGSGTTLVGAERLGRAARVIEKSPKYCDVIVERWAAISGGKPKRIRS